MEMHQDEPMHAKENQQIPNHNRNKLPPRMLTAAEVAWFLGVHVTTVRRWSQRGLLKSYKIGPRGSLRFKREDIFNFISSGRINSGPKEVPMGE